jgi:hypothetical protein
MLQFDPDTHTYTVDGKTLISVTQFKSTLFQPFDKDVIIQRMMASPKWPSSPYYQLTREQIIEKWDEASRLGTQMHANIETYLLTGAAEDDTPEFAQFKEFAKTMPPVFKTEWKVFDVDYGIAGTIDAVFRNEDGSLEIYDWKRTKSLLKYSSSKALHPALDLPDSNFWQYSVQLNLYRAILQKKGYEIAGMYLVCFHPTLSGYIKEQCPTIRVEDILSEEKKEADP